MYNGIPPAGNAADTPYMRYLNIETSLYPLVQQATGSPYRQLKPFDSRRYNKILERRGIDSQTLGPGPASPAIGGNKRPLTPKVTRPRAVR